MSAEEAVLHPDLLVTIHIMYRHVDHIMVSLHVCIFSNYEEYPERAGYLINV